MNNSGASQVAQVVKNPPASAGDIRDTCLIPELGRSPREGNCNPLKYSCLENSMDRGAWQATVQRVAKSQTQLKQLSVNNYTHINLSKLTNSPKMQTVTIQPV